MKYFNWFKVSKNLTLNLIANFFIVLGIFFGSFFVVGLTGSSVLMMLYWFFVPLLVLLYLASDLIIYAKDKLDKIR